MLYCHMLELYTYTCWIHIDAIIKTTRQWNIPLTLFERSVCERELETEQNCNILTPHSYGHQSYVFLVLMMLNRRSRAQLSAEYWLSLPQLVSNFWSSTNWLLIFTELYNSSIAHSIFGMACLIVIKRKWLSCSSQSLSSGASVYECTMGFYLVPFCQPSPPTRFLLITAIGMCHFSGASLWNGMFGQVEGQYTTCIVYIIFLWY